MQMTSALPLLAATNEILVGRIQIPQGGLQSSSVHFREPGEQFLQLRYIVRAGHVAKGASVSLICLDPLIEVIVIDEAAALKRALDLTDLRAVRIDAKLVGILHRSVTYLFFWFSIYCLMAFNGAPPTVETK